MVSSSFLYKIILSNLFLQLSGHPVLSGHFAIPQGYNHFIQVRL